MRKNRENQLRTREKNLLISGEFRPARGSKKPKGSRNVQTTTLTESSEDEAKEERTMSRAEAPRQVNKLEILDPNSSFDDVSTIFLAKDIRKKDEELEEVKEQDHDKEKSPVIIFRTPASKENNIQPKRRRVKHGHRPSLRSGRKECYSESRASTAE